MFTLKFYRKNDQGFAEQVTYTASDYKVTHLNDRIEIQWETPITNSLHIFSLGNGEGAFERAIIENAAGKTTDMFVAYHLHHR